MKILSRISSAVGLALALALGSVPANAQSAPSAPPTAAAIAAAKEILLMKNADAMFTSIVPNVVEKAKASLVQSNLNYQKDLSEVALIVAKNLAGRQSEIIGGMAQVYALQFTEQELKDLVVFYKTPLGQKVLTAEPRAIQASMAFVNQWAQQFSAVANEQFRIEMHKRGKDI
jgi:uncharacterized protein